MVPPCQAPAVLSEGKLSQSCSGDCLENLATFWTFRHSWDCMGSYEDLVLGGDLGKSEAEGAQPLPVAGEEIEACGLIPGHWWVRTKRQPGLGLLARKSCCPKSPLRLLSQPFLPALPPPPHQAQFRGDDHKAASARLPPRIGTRQPGSFPPGAGPW